MSGQSEAEVVDTAADERTARYVYGIVRSDAELPTLRGIDVEEVSMQRYGAVAALTSPAHSGRPYGTRDDLLAHDGVLRSVVAVADVVPLRFGAVMTDADAVIEDFVAPNEPALVEALEAVRGMVQFTLRGRYQQDVVLREIVAEDPRVSRLRRAVAGESPSGGYPEQIRLGETVVAALAAKRAIDSTWIAELLEPHATASSLSEPNSPDDVIDASFLVARGEHQPLEEAAEAAAQRGGDRISLRLLGPLAPYDFVAEVQSWGS